MKSSKRSRLKNNLIKCIVYVLIFILLVGTLFDFKVQNETKQYNDAVNSITLLAHESVYSLENKLTGYLKVMEGMALSYRDQPLTPNLLDDVEEKGLFDFSNLVIVNANGDILTKDDQIYNISSYDFFHKAMNKETVISYMDHNIILATPIYDRYEDIKGILMAILDSMQLNHAVSGNGFDHFINIMSRDGDFVYHNELSKIEGDNFFYGIEKMDKNLTVQEIKEAIHENETIAISISDPTIERMLYLHPLELTDWYVVMVIPYTHLHQKIQDMNFIVMLMIIKILLILALLSGSFYYFNYYDSRKIQALDDALSLKEKILKMALSKAEREVFVYDVDKDQLQFIVNSQKKYGLDGNIDDADEFLKCFWQEDPLNEQAHKNITKSFECHDLTCECEVMFKIENQPHYFKLNLTNVYDDSMKLTEVIGFMEEITAYKEQTLLLQKELQFKDNLVTDTIGYMQVDVNEDVILNCSENIMSGQTSDMKFSKLIEIFIRKRIAESFKEYAMKKFSNEWIQKQYEVGNHDFVLEYQNIDSNHVPFWISCQMRLKKDEDGHVIALIIWRDINELKQKEIILTRTAQIDELTGIYNRRAGLNKIKEIIDQKDGRKHALAFIDVDNFKSVNDTLGHSAGDRLLAIMAEVFRNHFQNKDIVCRIGGDEFVALMVDVNQEEIPDTVQSLLDKVKTATEKEGYQVSVTLSIGIALMPEDADNFTDLYDKADRALYKIKNNSKNSYLLYQDSMSFDK